MATLLAIEFLQQLYTPNTTLSQICSTINFNGRKEKLTLLPYPNQIVKKQNTLDWTVLPPMHEGEVPQDCIGSLGSESTL